ncbi:septum formation initiator family protein [Thermosyntropha sp.]|uniref:FtsB family cell division protein n=1 Tax=Thermosyntropha sp. TaxID=2740820 RepID=UPI0025E51609|nr:septum formation initiator family protein [Thermosyntropha sp.]MBO8159761.1 septum formation initiator family protein [Thermosyntropha sp.]
MKNKSKSLALKKILIIALCFFLLFPVGSRVKTVWKLNERKKELEAIKAELVTENKRLKEEYEKARSLENIERIAREKLGMVKEGEKPLVEVVIDE